LIWQECDGAQAIRPIAGRLWRLVESQEQVATLELVDTLEEQILLEDMLETSKPAYATHDDGLHYLLKTPFRYPPLPWGSRFGSTHERGIFYAGKSISTALAESAFYRLVFWHSMQAPPVKPVMRSEHTLFSVDYRTPMGIRLQDSPFDRHEAALRHPAEYQPTQQLGQAMREAGVHAFEYLSARDANKGICIGLFDSDVFVQQQPLTIQPWLCQLNANEVSFKANHGTELYRFGIEQFLFHDELPRPSA
jgi:hypothetical protein